jgi:hypothetical protein
LGVGLTFCKKWIMYRSPKGKPRPNMKKKKEKKNVYNYHHTRAFWKVSSHFEYLENRSLGLDVTWKKVRGYHTVHP